MALGNAELERIADDMYKGRLLGHAVYCGNCGYNLKTLPYRYVCPECGSEYNARPRKMTGIFVPQEAEFPIRDIFSTLICALCAWGFGRDALPQRDPFWLTVTAVIAVIGCVFAWHVCTGTMHLIKTIGILRCIAETERDDRD